MLLVSSLESESESVESESESESGSESESESDKHSHKRSHKHKHRSKKHRSKKSKAMIPKPYGTAGKKGTGEPGSKGYSLLEHLGMEGDIDRYLDIRVSY